MAGKRHCPKRVEGKNLFPFVQGRVRLFYIICLYNFVIALAFSVPLGQSCIRTCYVKIALVLRLVLCGYRDVPDSGPAAKSMTGKTQKGWLRGLWGGLQSFIDGNLLDFC